MSGIAEVLLNLGYSISGSDLQDSAVTRRLASLGARVFIGHTADNIKGAGAIVTSTAVAGDNPEVLAVWPSQHVVSGDAAAREAIQGRPDVRLGVQNVYWEASGAFTGELSVGMAKDAGAELVLIGQEFDRNILDLGREMRLSYLPPLMVYMAAGIAGLHVRPTVSLALKALSEQGILVRQERRWLLDRDSWRLLDDEAALPAAG